MSQKIFEGLAGLIPSGGTVTMTLHMKGEKMTILMSPNFENEDFPLVPVSLCAPPAELEDQFMEALVAYTPAVTELANTVEQARIAAETKAAEIKAKVAAGKKKTKAETEAEALEKRKAARLDNGEMNVLVTVPSSDTNFDAALMRASKATLEAALAAPELHGVIAMKRIATELAKLCDKGRKELLTEALTPKYRSAESGAKEALGKALEEASGKTLEDLGLAPRQMSMFDTLAAV